MAVGLAAMPLLLVLSSLCFLLTSRYLRSPAKKALSRCRARPAGITPGRCLPGAWVLLLLTPARPVLDDLIDAGFYVISPGRAVPRSGVLVTSAWRGCWVLDRGRYDRIHVIAHSQGSLVALDLLQGIRLRHPLVLTTLGSPAGGLYRDTLEWPLDPAALAASEWCNLYHVDDPVGGPVGLDGVDAVLPPGGHTGYWSNAVLADRVVQAMQAPLPGAEG